MEVKEAAPPFQAWCPVCRAMVCTTLGFEGRLSYVTHEGEGATKGWKGRCIASNQPVLFPVIKAGRFHLSELAA